MRKSDIVKIIVNKTGIETADVNIIVEAFLTTVKKEVGKGQSLSLRGFGTFCTRTRKARKGRDIGRGQIINIPQRVSPHFKPSKKYFKIIQ